MLNRIPVFLFAFAVIMASVGYGVLMGRFGAFPYEAIVSGLKTGIVLFSKIMKKDIGLFEEFTNVTPEHAASNRIQFIAGDRLTDPVLLYGGRFQFSDICPGHGCLAVEYSTTGKVAHAYPYRPDEIYNANITDAFPYEALSFTFSKDAYPVGISQYSNGDLLVVFHNIYTFPYSGGIARIDRNGNPVWFRRDYSHHWPTLLEDDVALVPGLTIGGRFRAIRLKGKKRFELHCNTGKMYVDQIDLLDKNGELLKQVSVLDQLLESPFRAVLEHTTDHCDPLHLNYIEKIPENAASMSGIDPGDFVVSLRNVSAFGIMDGKDGHFKRLVRGAFFKQHSVHYLDKAKFLMFDNYGGDKEGGPSRLLMIDLASGMETTIFPTRRTPETWQEIFSDELGHIDISPDRQRAIVTFSNLSKAIEVRLSDGEVLNAFTSLHDASGVEELSNERHAKAARYRLFGVNYARKDFRRN